MYERRVAIMQPYIFPYIGYFHLIQASSMFVFYDDVTYIKGGWINRNRISNQNKALLFTVPVSEISSNKLIKETSPVIDAKWNNKLYKQMIQSYKKAPFFKNVIEPIMSVFSKQYVDITDLSIESISVIYSYLGIKFTHTKSSSSFPETQGMEKVDRIIEITKALECNNYINAIGGKELYSKKQFLNKGINLSFVKSNPIEYPQYSDCFIPWLSIIDIIMFCSKEQTIDFLSDYSLE